MKYLSVALASALLFPAISMAQTPYQLDEIIFSAGLTALEANRTGVSVEVVTEEELQRAGDVQLSEFLATLPGISVTQNGPMGAAATLRIRGLNGNYIPVLINGIDMTDPSLPQAFFDFGTLTTGGLARIEVLYGSQGPIYGAQAIAGVISITTLAPPDEIGTEITINAEAGSYETYLGSLGIATRFDRGTLAFTAARTVTEGFSAADANLGNTEEDGFRDTTVTVTGTYDLTETVTLGASLIWQDTFVEFDAFGGAGGDSADYSTGTRRAARIFATFDGVYVDHEIAFSVSETVRANPTSTFATGYTGERQTLSYTGTVDLAGDSTLVIGAEHTRERYAAELTFGTDPRGEADISSIFGEYTVALGDTMDLAVALRHDAHSTFGGATTGRVALAWRPGPDTVLRTSLATGFRAPSLNELYGPFGANQDLDPETSRSFEVSLEQDFARGEIGASLFYTEIDDLIIYTTAYNQVPGTSVSQGLELTGALDLTDALSLFGNYTYTDARDRSGARLLRVPYHDLSLGLRGEIHQWSGSLSVQHVADRLDTQFPLVIDLPDYTVANMSIGYAVTDEMEVYLRIVNLFDAQYQTTVGYGTSDRAAYLGIRARF